MADLDLIPNEYRTWLQQQALLKRFTAVFVGLILLVVAADHVLSIAATRTALKADELRRQSEISQQQQSALLLLLEQKAGYQRHWALLQSLRAGAAIEDIFQIVDRAIAAGDLWLLDWNFRRAGVVAPEQERGVNTGRFIIVAAENDLREQQQLQVETHMSIHGQAKDHQALSTFVRGLFAERLVKDVSVSKTSLSENSGGSVVNFDITVVLNSPSQES